MRKWNFNNGGVSTLNLDDIIEYDEENTNLDFKKEEYYKNDYVSLLKDVSSMANALNIETKRIIIGIKHRPGEDKEFVGVEKLTDQATLENIIQENIEPNINFKYYPYKFKNVTLGIIEIYDNYDKPYMMRKDYATLKKGEMWIRKGSRQSRVIREDLDKMFDLRKKAAFDNKVAIGFGKELEKEITILKVKVPRETFPSEIKKRELEDLIKRIDERYNISAEENDKEPSVLAKFALDGMKLFGEFRDSDKSIRIGYDRFTKLPIYQNKEEILKNIEEIGDIYYDNDCYYLFEENSTKFNCQIYNDGTEFLEDVKIELFFDSNVFIVAEKIYEKPHGNPLLYNEINTSDYNYPSIYIDDNYIVAENYHNKIRHKTLTNFFDEDLRILIKQNIDVDDTEVKYKIGAKNLAHHIEGTLKILIK